MSAQKLTRAEAARRNGALSRGSLTPATKMRSARNSITHGLTARSFLSTPAEIEAFSQHLQALRDHWDPQTSYEAYFVGKLARAQYLHDRAETLQVSLLDLEIDTNAEKIQETFQTVDPEGLLAIGFRSLDDSSHAFQNLERHLTRLHRESLRMAQKLEQLIAARKRAEAGTPAPATRFEESCTDEPNAIQEIPLCPAA